MGAGLIAHSSKPVRLDETSYTYFISSCRFRSHLHSRSSIIYEFFLLLLCYTQPDVLWLLFQQRPSLTGLLLCSIGSGGTIDLEFSALLKVLKSFTFTLLHLLGISIWQISASPIGFILIPENFCNECLFVINTVWPRNKCDLRS